MSDLSNVKAEGRQTETEMTKSRGVGRGGRRKNQTGRPRKVVAPPPPGPFDARAILQAIASDPYAATGARVAAAKALLPRSEPDDADRDRERGDEITRRSLAIMRERPN